ncbi:MAG TPA: NAD(+) diphosphatase [Bauldia sp.]|nr:NAD(+) diphosphatase [Bauldia sp.]
MGFFDGMPAVEPSARVGFAGNRIERRSEHRSADAVPAAVGDDRARFYLFRGDKVLLRGSDPLFEPREADGLGAVRDETVLLGWAGDGPRLASLLPDSAQIDEQRIGLVDLRTVATGAMVTPEHLGALAQARALMNWHGRHRFCSNCGAATTIANGGYRRDCPRCQAQHFPRTDPVVIMLAIRNERVLLGRQRQFQPGMYSALAGFLEPGETIEDAVRRETLEESGVPIGRVRYHASQPWPFPMSLMIGCHCEALSDTISRDEAELEDCRWFTRDEARAMLAGTHPDGLKAPTNIAIARTLLAAWSGG